MLGSVPFTTDGRTEDGSIRSRTAARRSPGKIDSCEEIFLTLAFVFSVFVLILISKTLPVFSLLLGMPPEDS